MITYKSFLLMDINIAPLGVELRTDNTPYFCTPRGATVLGWAGVDGIHYCTVRGYGDTVFAISPMNAPGEYVHPIAKNFEDFLRLLIACKDAAALEQAWQWDEAQFSDFLRGNPPSAEQQAAAKALADATELTPMPSPWRYIHDLQSGFDYSHIKYTYYEASEDSIAPSKWHVRYRGGIYGGGRERPGTEIAINKVFEWYGDEFYVPSAYACAKGLVLDIFTRVPSERISAFIEKYNLDADSDESDFDDDTARQIDDENPLQLSYSPSIVLNGKSVASEQGFSICWNPIMPNVNDAEIRAAIQHYSLDSQCGWIMSRWSFPWKRRQEINSLSIIISANNTRIDGPIIGEAHAGMSIRFTHPVSGVEHTLTVTDIESETIESEMSEFPRHMQADLVFPTHYTALTYLLEPEIAQGEFYVRDCENGDAPRRVCAPSARDNAEGADNSVCIIGGADGPTAIFVSAVHRTASHIACSSMRFEPYEHVKWRIEFYVKLRSDINAKLI